MEIAVVGMAGRFPGAPNLHEFWQNLKNGVETTCFYSDNELRDAGIEPQLLNNPAFVKTGGSILENKGYFDASFFGYTPMEAQTLDPQTRVFMETAWQTLEDGGYDPASYDGLIGLYAGSAWNFAWEAQVHLGGSGNALGTFSSWLLANRDNLCTLTSYKLGLKGPVIFLKTTCSTALVAIHLACQAILNGECHMALAGGVSLSQNVNPGYLYQDGMIHSPDGHCRAFDAQAMGTIGGEGVGIVLLKRLEDAITDSDIIHAIIKGTAINNDGSRKIGYTAPSIAGQVDVIREALTVAAVDPESISYVETHGTGTPVGDPIEIEALRTAFDSQKKGFCRIGSVKTNIGHLDAAAGIAGFIKTVLALKHHAIPPSLHFQTQNPKIDFENTPFRVNTSLYDWQNNQYPLRAGVSSFGIGGTNAHIILEESPAHLTPVTDTVLTHAAPEESLLLLSARSQSVLGQMTQNLAAYLLANPQVNLADVAYTLQTGRRAFKYRLMAMVDNMQQTIETLTNPDSKKIHTHELQQEQKDVILMFPGLGGQYVNMGLDLYRTQPVFREHLDHCFEILHSLTPIPFKEILYPTNKQDSSIGEDAQSIHAPEIAPVVIFIFEYALAQLVMTWGIRPRAMIGYSFGEYVAACLAGVFSLEDALHIVLFRGQLLNQTAAGAMLSVPVPKETVFPFLPGSSLFLAVDNGPSCILSGSIEAVAAFEIKMKANRIISLRLSYANRAIHSAMMDPVLEKFSQYLHRFTFHEPQIPYISNVTGQMVAADEVTKPSYWAAHLAQTVRFADGVSQLLNLVGWNSPACTGLFLEVGPGYDLSVLIRHFGDNQSRLPVLHLVEHARGKTPANRYLLNQLGRLWLAGVPILWNSFYTHKNRSRVSLPPYPFEGQEYLGVPASPALSPVIAKPQSPTGKNPDIADWFYVPTWKRSPLTPPKHTALPQKKCWLLFADLTGLCLHFAQELEQSGQEVFIVRCGPEFKKISSREFIIDPSQAQDYNTLFHHFNQENIFPDHIVHFWSVTATSQNIPVDELQDLGFYSLFYLAQAVGRHSINEPLPILVVSNHLFRVTATENLCPGKATLLGAIKVIPKEYFNISCRSIDILWPLPDNFAPQRLVEQLVAECVKQTSDSLSPDTVIAYRGDYRWVQVFEPCPSIHSNPIATCLKDRGVYLITGGLGGIGLTLAKHLADTRQAKLVLTRRSPFPPREQWAHLLTILPPKDPTCQKIRTLLDMENAGAEVLVCNADVTDLTQMQSVISQARQRFGTINGVIHAAGLPDGGVIARRTRQTITPILAPKVTGTLILNQVLNQQQVKLDFFLLCSSISSILGILGQIAYCAANAFLDAFAYTNTHENNVFTQSLNWDFWKEVGMGAETIQRLQESANITDGDLLLQAGILSSEGLVIFERVLATPYIQVVISPQDFSARFGQADYQGLAQPQGTPDQMVSQTHPVKLHPRPPLSTEYTEPTTSFEKTFADMLQQYFGFQQVGIDDNLFEYGITSLDMIHINNNLKEKIRTDIPIVVMFEYPTIHSLGQYLENRDQNTMNRNSGLKQTKPVENLDEVEETLHQSLDMFDVS